MRWWAVLIWAGLMGCDGCRPDGEPGQAGRWMPKTYGARVALRLDAAIQFERSFSPLLDRVLTEDQRARLAEEMKRSFGFDPTQADGLSQAGLNPQGVVVAGLEPDGALVSIPAERPDRVFEQLRTIMVDRIGSEPTAEDGLLRFERSFGPETAQVAALARHGSVVLLATGPEAAQRLRAARKLPEAEASSDLELGSAAFRGIFRPDSDQVLRALRSLPQTAPVDESAVRELLDGLGLLRLEGHWLTHGARVEGHQALKESGPLRALQAGGAAPDRMASLDATDAFLLLRAGIDPQALYERMVPKGGPVDEAIDRARKEGRLRVEPKDLAEALTGHFGWAVGGGNLRDVPFQALVGNPLAHVWMLFAVGKEADSTLSLQGLAEDFESSEQVALQQMEFSGFPAVRVDSPQGGQLATVVQAEDLVILGNEDAILQRVLQAPVSKGGSDALFNLELRFDPLEKVIRTFPGSRLPLMFRALWARGLDALGALRVLSFESRATSSGVKFRGELQLDPPSAP